MNIPLQKLQFSAFDTCTSASKPSLQFWHQARRKGLVPGASSSAKSKFLKIVKTVSTSLIYTAIFELPGTLSDHGQQRPRYLLVGHMPSDTAYFSWLRSEEEVVYCACPENVNKSAAVGRWQDLLLSSCLY